MTTFRLDEAEGGYLFSILNPTDSVVELGLLIEAASSRHSNVSLIYGDSRKFGDSSRAIASFLVPKLTEKWTRLSVKVYENEVILYLNCRKFDSVTIDKGRRPKQLTFGDSSKLYVAQAGPIIHREFIVSFLSLFLA